MNKNNIETYEYLSPAGVCNNTSESQNNQYFLVQGDSTFILNQQVQYVTEEQTVKEGMQDMSQCAVYDASSQQFFVDMDNSTEMVAVSDQYILPSTEDSLYTNQYLIQPVSDTSNQVEENVTDNQVEQNEAVEICESGINSTNAQPTNNNVNYTEVTLNEDQCQILDKIGWVLLNNDDKMFVLDNLGLHDITTNESLIQNLKNELLQIGYIFSPTNAENCQSNQINTENALSQEMATESVIEATSIEENDTDQEDKLPYIDVEEADRVKEDVTQETINEGINIQHAIEVYTRASKPETSTNRDNNILRLKTNLNLKEIPSKIILGKTATGKNIVARVIKSHFNNSKNAKQEEVLDNGAEIKVPTNISTPKTNSLDYFGRHQVFILEPLIQKALAKNNQTLYTEADIVTAKNVITQLLGNTVFKNTLISANYIFITKVVIKDDYHVIDNSMENISFVMGRVTSTDGGQKEFLHEPDIKKILDDCAPGNVSQLSSDNHRVNVGVSYNIGNELHIHIAENKSTHESRISKVNIRKCRISLNATVKNHNQSMQDKKKGRKYACSTCAALFPTMEELGDHQEMQCDDPNELQITDKDIEKLNKSAGYRLARKYSCQYCGKSFNRSSYYKTHINSHNVTKKPKIHNIEDINGQKTIEERGYKCNMCSCVHSCQSELTKHIVEKHVLKDY